MLRPVGSHSASVYWRRRLVVLGSVALLIVLIVLTVNAMNSGNGGTQAGGTGTPTSTQRSSSSLRPTSASSTVSATTPRATKHSGSSPTSSRPSSPTASPTATCVTGSLKLRAVSTKSTYKVGDNPTLQLQVTNPGPQPCVQDLADKQVELRVYNGESRVWGSHDCKVEPGTTDRTLSPNVSVLVSIRWSGFTSDKGCKGTRQRVGAGTYTLYALLAGRTGTATQFTIN